MEIQKSIANVIDSEGSFCIHLNRVGEIVQIIKNPRELHDHSKFFIFLFQIEKAIKFLEDNSYDSINNENLEHLLKERIIYVNQNKKN